MFTAYYAKGSGIESADGRQFIDFEAGDDLGPEHDALRIAADGFRDFHKLSRSCLAILERQPIFGTQIGKGFKVAVARRHRQVHLPREGGHHDVHLR